MYFNQSLIRKEYKASKLTNDKSVIDDDDDEGRKGGRKEGLKEIEEAGEDIGRRHAKKKSTM